MKKALLAAILFISSFQFCSADSDELILITSADNPPYEVMRAGEIVGFDIDLAKEIADKLGKTLYIKDMPFSSIIPALISKQGDLAIASITPTDARRENVDFSIPYMENISAIVLANVDEFPNMKQTNAVFPLKILEGKTVGVQLGTHHETDIRAANIPNLKIKRYDSIGTMVAEISKSTTGKGGIYALIIGTSEAKMLVKKNPKLCYFPLKFSDSFAVALPKNSHLKEDINKIIELLKENGKLFEFEVKWDVNQ